MENAIQISVPGGLVRTDAVLAIADKLRSAGKNIEVQAYDTVQGLQWNGGRLIVNRTVADITPNRLAYDVTLDNLGEAVRRIRRLNEAGISFCFTFNNVLENLEVDDPEGNYLLSQLHSEMNAVTVSTRALAHHVRSNYPKFKLVSSICFVHDTFEKCKKACDDYDLVVMLPEFAYQEETFTQLPVEKLSFIINDDCFLFCRRKDHYQAVSRCSLAGNSSRVEQERNLQLGSCFARQQPGYLSKRPEGMSKEFCDRVTKAVKQQKVKDEDALPGHHEYNITKATRAELLRRGVRHFKLQGRAAAEYVYHNAVEEYLERFVRDEL